MRRTVDWIVESSGRVDLINITGGEPTLHPDCWRSSTCCRRPEIGRITMNSNGIRLAEDLDLCRRLAELGVYVILSLNTFDPEVSRRLHGRDLVAVKQRAIENLAPGRRAHDAAERADPRRERGRPGRHLPDLMRQHDHILSLTVQTMTYTGQGGGQFPAGAAHSGRRGGADRLPAIRAACLKPDDFVTRPVGPSAVLPGLLPAQERRPAAAVRAVSPLGTRSSSCWPIRTCCARLATISSPTRSTSSMPTARRSTWRRCGGWSSGSIRRAGDRRLPAAADRRGERADRLPPRPHGRGHVRLLAGDALSRPGAGRAGPADPGLHLQPVLPHAGRAVLRRAVQRRRAANVA